MEQKPSLGRIVLFRSEPANGVNEHPAIITRVWSDTCVNLTVFLDAGAPFIATSAMQNEEMLSGDQLRCVALAAARVGGQNAEVP
jgi:hypothetical protein